MKLDIVIAQLNPHVGDMDGNARKVVAVLEQLAGQAVDVLVFPELVLSGYPPEDLLLRDSLQQRVEAALELVREASRELSCHIVLGYPLRRDGKLYNCAGVLFQGELVAEYHKQKLPNYQVFDEKRYFEAGCEPALLEIKGVKTALSICEDIWHPQPMAQAREAGAQLMININASPFHIDKQREREVLLAERAQSGAMPVVYVNQTGGQDELVFDGGSMVVAKTGELLVRLPAFVEETFALTLDIDNDSASAEESALINERLEGDAAVYTALVHGVRDYVNKNGFPGVVLGLSGGIDSALTLAIAVDALGPERVEAVMMPFRYTSSMSVEDAEAEAKTLGVEYRCISIEPMYEAFMQSLDSEFAGWPKDTTEENIQARCRGVLLMAISNKKGSLVLTTGNKSEMAVGYCTLYGDMAGGFAVIKDVPKMQVYALSNYRNSLSPAIPQRVIDRPPSAELAPDQKDEDSLPPYDVLDQILALYVEQDVSAYGIIARGFAEEDVKRVIRLIDINEYKRRQAPIGVRVTQRGFGRDRRYPITNGWRPGE